MADEDYAIHGLRPYIDVLKDLLDIYKRYDRICDADRMAGLDNRTFPEDATDWLDAMHTLTSIEYSSTYQAHIAQEEAKSGS